MLDMKDGAVVVIPKMPERNQFTIARVSGRYRFKPEVDLDDFGHIVTVHRDSVRTFGYRADNDAFLVSGLFARANYRSAVSFCDNAEQVEAAHRLLQRQSNPTSKPQKELSRAAIDDVFKTAATALRDQVKDWNGPRFEEAVRQALSRPRLHDQRSPTLRRPRGRCRHPRVASGKSLWPVPACGENGGAKLDHRAANRSCFWAE